MIGKIALDRIRAYDDHGPSIARNSKKWNSLEVMPAAGAGAAREAGVWAYTNGR